ncbi:Lpg1974 family pore-forming outer membrane protein [Rosistilla carotiformis]|uniref:Lpg1974 family pore-forming outer membrane protein n=1 Tax=Rosistilla carotiformis TaxID=2528017 RepID=UPI0018D23776|nr:Lpg1974 family pore-forming outer membrane protein [Rosistilla carotiformis]
MKKLLQHVGVAVGLVCGVTASAEQAVVTSVYEEAMIADQEPVQLVGYESVGAIGSQLQKFRPRGVFSVGAELPLLSTYANHGLNASSSTWSDGYDTEAALRVTAAYQTTGIMGFRGRFFDFGASSNGDPNTTFDVQTYDLEATTDLKLGEWKIQGFGGLRWGSIDFSKSRWGGFENHEFDGFGFTLGADVRRHVAHGFSLVAGFRQSMLYGETVSNVGNRLDNVVVPVTELRLGAEYAHVFACGNKVIAGVGYEHQQFSSLSSLAGTIDPEDVDLALAGPVFSLTWQR